MVRSLRSPVLRLLLIVSICASVAGCGGSSADAGAPRVLTQNETKHLLLEFPYRFSFQHVALPQSATGAIGGRINGPRHTSFDFGLSLGKSAEPVLVPDTNLPNVVRVGPAGFVWTDNTTRRARNGKLIVGRSIHSGAQLREAGHIEVEIEEKLCKAATGKPCPV